MRPVSGGVALSCAAAALVFCASPSLAQQQKVGSPPEALNMHLVGSNDLQGRSAYQPTIAHQGDRYIAYIGHHGGTPEVPKPMNVLSGQAEFNGTSIVDVTDPAHPKYLKHIPGLEGNYEDGGGQMTRVCPDSMRIDPSECMVKAGVIRVGRSCPGARPSSRVMVICLYPFAVPSRRGSSAACGAGRHGRPACPLPFRQSGSARA